MVQALYYVARMDDVFGRFWLPDFLFESAWTVKPITWIVLAIEVAVAIRVMDSTVENYSYCGGVLAAFGDRVRHEHFLVRVADEGRFDRVR